MHKIEKVFELKTQQLYFIHPFPRWLKLGKSLQTCWRFKREKSMFWKVSFLQNKNWLRMQDFVYKTAWLVRIFLFISAITKNFAFFLGKVNLLKAVENITFFPYWHSLIYLTLVGLGEFLDSYASPRLRLRFAELSQILPGQSSLMFIIMFTSGYTNMENVFYCLNLSVAIWKLLPFPSRYCMRNPLWLDMSMILFPLLIT